VFSMVERLRKEGITDELVLSVMERVDRKDFVPSEHHAYSYENRPLPIGYGQTISQPFIVAFMTQLLELRGDERVLEIGTGSGYQTAILANLCSHIYTVEVVRALSSEAGMRLNDLGHSNISFRVGDGYSGWEENAPYDRIIVTAAPEEIPQVLTSQLKDGGIMVVPVGPRYATQTLWKVSKVDGSLHKQDYGGVAFVPLVAED
jgi:protein-L-isoaspartate(D-aspartate) O-methyltransferase